MFSSKCFEESRILQCLSFPLCWRLDEFIRFFLLTVSDAMAAAHSGSSLVTYLSNNTPSIRINCGVTCTVLSSNERLFMFVRESSCWTRFERRNRSKDTGFFLDKIFISAASSTGNSGWPGIGFQACPTISSREALHKSLCPETRTLL